jgi:hypothetical protein
MRHSSFKEMSSVRRSVSIGEESKVFQSSVFDVGAFSVYDLGFHPALPLEVPVPWVLQLWGIWFQDRVTSKI